MLGPETLPRMYGVHGSTLGGHASRLHEAARPRRVQPRHLGQLADKAGMIVYTYGVFDLFHVGHLKLLREARGLGGYLIVGVYTDAIAEGFKRRPVIPFEQRLEIVRSIFEVNEAIEQREFNPDANIRSIKPQILTKGPGAGWEPDADVVPGQEVIESMGGKVVRLDYHDGVSTSAIIERIKGI